jgi:hypothetical protein
VPTTRVRRLVAHNAAILTLTWAAIWAAAAAAGLRFDTFDLEFWHFIDPALLRSAPIESLFYLHSQPPLFNALVAAALAAFGDAYAIPLYLLFALMALATALAAASLAQALTGRRAPGLVAGGAILLSPSLIAYGHVLFHALPSAFLVTTAAWAARRALVQPSWGRLALVVALLTAGTLLWSPLHPAWLAVCLAGLVWAAREARARAATLAAASLALVAAFIIKNGILFGVWELSSWTGMNLARITVQELPRPERDAAIAAGDLSPVARHRAFGRLKSYPELAAPPPTGIPLLDRPSKESGEPNYHHLAYIEISRLYRGDAMTVVRTRPGTYLAAVGKAFWTFYMRPATDFLVAAPAVRQLGWYASLYDAIVYGAPPGRPGRHDMRDVRAGGFWSNVAMSPLLRIWFLAALIGGPIWLVRLARSHRLRTPDGIAAVALVGPLLYITAVCNLAELGENMRFRFTVEPAALILVVVGATAALRRLRR